MKTSRANLYEEEEVREALGEALRPGGLAVTRAALDLCGFPPRARLLDVGCGAGATLRFLKENGFEASGLDQSATLLATARHYGETARGDFQSLPWPEAHFDGVFCECVLNLAADRQAVLAECARVLKAGGRLIISDMFRRPAATAGLAQTLRGLGFEVAAEKDYGRDLKDWAARLVWNSGSRDILKTLCPAGLCGAGRLTYSLLIAEKKEKRS